MTTQVKPVPAGVKFRKGDQIALFGAIKYEPDGDGSVFVSFDGDVYHDIMVRADRVNGLVKEAIAVGDHVICNGDAEEPGAVLAIAGDVAWVELNRTSNRFVTVKITELERDPDFEEVAEAGPPAITPPPAPPPGQPAEEEIQF